MLTEGDLCCVIIAVAANRNRKGKKKGFQKGRNWSNSFVNGEKNTRNLLNAWRVIESNDFRLFVRMNTDLLVELLALVAPKIEKKTEIFIYFLVAYDHSWLRSNKEVPYTTAGETLTGYCAM